MTEDAPTRPKPASKGERKPLVPGPDGVIRLSGGNPQIPKGEGDGPVQAYIRAMLGWQSEVGRRLDRLIVQAVPDVHKSVRWNSPFYGTDPGTWFTSYHCMTKYVKVSFPNGARMEPPPPGSSKQQNVRYLDIYEDSDLTDEQLLDWFRQAAALPGERF